MHFFHTDELQFGDAADAENGKFALVGVRFDKVFVACNPVDLTYFELLKQVQNDHCNEDPSRNE